MILNSRCESFQNLQCFCKPFKNYLKAWRKSQDFNTKGFSKTNNSFEVIFS